MLFGIWTTQNLLSQRSPSFSQYSFDSYIINPAAAGSEGYTIFSLVAREQWLGINGAPVTRAFNFQARTFKKTYKPLHAKVRKINLRLLQKGKVGIGINLMDDKTGIFERTSLKVAYAYHINKSRSQFSFGLGLSLSQLKIDFNNVKLEIEDAEIISEMPKHMYLPDFNIGFNYKKDKLYAGFSIDNLAKVVSFGSGNLSDGSQRMYNLIGGLILDISGNIRVEPSLYLKSSDFFAYQEEINFKLTIHENYWIGFTLRSPKSTSFQIGTKYRRLFIGFAYDYGYNDLQKYSCGTHEVMLAIKLGDNTKRYRWLERY
jgi:type IX secretion system PorP/SprF family membrane protein